MSESSVLASRETAAMLEYSEARAYAAMIGVAPPALAARYRLEVHHFGAALAVAAPGAQESLVLNRVIGAGLDHTIDALLLDHLDDMYRTVGVTTYALELSPWAQSKESQALLSARGFIPIRRTCMLLRDAAAPPAGDGGVEVALAEERERAEVADLCCHTFRLGEPFASLLIAAAASQEWQMWIGRADGAVASAAMLHFHGDVAWIGWAATLPAFRGRGFHKAIAERQLLAAKGRGARWVTLETAVAPRGQKSPSQRNYERLGWSAAYERITYVVRRPQEGGTGSPGPR